MKPLYIFLLLAAGFITALSDGISAALMAIPELGLVLSIAITFCINATMGVGLVFALVSNGMWHPKFGPVALIGGLLPGLNFLPFWIGLVGAGIVHDMSNEGGVIGEAAKIADTVQSGANPLAATRTALSASKNMERLTTGRPPAQEANDNEPQAEEKSRSPLNLKSPGTSMNSDIARPRAATPENSQLHAQVA